MLLDVLHWTPARQWQNSATSTSEFLVATTDFEFHSSGFQRQRWNTGPRGARIPERSSYTSRMGRSRMQIRSASSKRYRAFRLGTSVMRSLELRRSWQRRSAGILSRGPRSELERRGVGESNYLHSETRLPIWRESWSTTECQRI